MHHKMPELVSKRKSQIAGREKRVQHEEWAFARRPNADRVDFGGAKLLGDDDATRSLDPLGQVLDSMGRVTDRRADFCAQTAVHLVTKNALVVLEDLKIRNMAASASGTQAAPGTRVAQKRGLNRAILDKGWHRLELALTSAARYTGTRVAKVNPAFTSQRCSACGFASEGNRESQAVFACKAPGCGHTAHADVNAAINIKHAAGHAVSACGDLGTSRSAKQEPVSRATGRNPS